MRQDCDILSHQFCGQQGAMITITELNLKKCKTSKSACEREREKERQRERQRERERERERQTHRQTESERVKKTEK